MAKGKNYFFLKALVASPASNPADHNLHRGHLHLVHLRLHQRVFGPLRFQQPDRQRVKVLPGRHQGKKILRGAA